VFYIFTEKRSKKPRRVGGAGAQNAFNYYAVWIPCPTPGFLAAMNCNDNMLCVSKLLLYL